MKHYRVRLMQTVLEDTWVTVEAENEAAAEAAAFAVANGEDPEQPAIDWHFVECIGDLEATQIEEQPYSDPLAPEPANPYRWVDGQPIEDK